MGSTQIYKPANQLHFIQIVIFFGERLKIMLQFEELRLKLEGMEPELRELRQSLNIDKLGVEIAELERKAAEVFTAFELEGKLDNVNNYCIAVKEKGEDIVFLRKIVKGGADRSYGIQVAKLAGVPDSVINRAKEICQELIDNNITCGVESLSPDKRTHQKVKKLDEVDKNQISLFDTVDDDDILNEIKELDLGNYTPIEALNKLYELQGKLKNRW